MATVRELGPMSIRVVCDCGDYIHDVERNEDTGKLACESFLVKKKKADPPPPPDKGADPQAKPKKRFKTFFEIEEEEKGGK